MLKGLQSHYGNNGVKYFSLINNGIKFCEYVGVLRVGNAIIEILPKADRNKKIIDESEQIVSWRKNLIGMLQAVGLFKVQAPTSSNLQLRPNSILDLYFELFVREVEYLMHRGLVKKYRKTEGNVKALKGSLKFAKHIQNNVVHQERFYVRYTTYDKDHQLHHILYKAIQLLNRINTNINLSSRLSALMLDFPEMPNINVSDALFSKISYDRKTDCYKPAIDIARLLLLNYYPDLSKGNDDVLALMFDMNNLWERFVYVSLHKYGMFNSVEAQDSRSFWKADKGLSSYMKPDIVINKSDSTCVVLDTKWKNLHGMSPSPQDLRQMYVYMKYYDAKKVALVYPGEKDNVYSGRYTREKEYRESSVIELSVEDKVEEWQKNIANYVSKWIEK